MLQEVDPPQCDLGFVRLHLNGSVIATFRISRLVLSSDIGEFQADLKSFTLFLKSYESGYLTRLVLPNEVVSNWLPAIKRAESFVISHETRAAVATNTNTGLQLLRCNGATLLKTWRSREYWFFIHYQGSWTETDDEGATHFLNNWPEVNRHDDIPF
ncbi:MAG: hypothetical protein ABSA26_13955 [Thermoguttaceae bacterium]|jgi:hypothetical protein